jgi:hypothetical protein
VTFRFSKPEHKAMFDAAPEKYLPQYGGYCTNGIVYGIPWGGNADTWEMIGGKLYIFGGRGSRDAFMLDVAAQHGARREVLGRGGERLERVLAALEADGVPRAALQERRGAREGSRCRASAQVLAERTTGKSNAEAQRRRDTGEIQCVNFGLRSTQPE